MKELGVIILEDLPTAEKSVKQLEGEQKVLEDGKDD
jgi:hypothetical protein